MKLILPKYSFTIESTTNHVFHANTGEGLPRHDHEYAHATVCHAGKLAVRKENFYMEMTKDTNPIMLRALEWHELEALEDGTVFENIFAEPDK